MSAGSPAGHTGAAERRPAIDERALPYSKRCKMKIEREEAEPVIEHDGVTAEVERRRQHDPPGLRRHHRRALGYPQVLARVRAPLLAIEETAKPEGRAKRSLGRQDEGTAPEPPRRCGREDGVEPRLLAADAHQAAGIGLDVAAGDRQVLARKLPGAHGEHLRHAQRLRVATSPVARLPTRRRRILVRGPELDHQRVASRWGCKVDSDERPRTAIATAEETDLRAPKVRRDPSRSSGRIVEHDDGEPSGFDDGRPDLEPRSVGGCRCRARRRFHSDGPHAHQRLGTCRRHLARAGHEDEHEDHGGRTRTTCHGAYDPLGVTHDALHRHSAAHPR